MEWSITAALVILLVLLAYFIKGFSGFGPALVIVPFIAIFYDPHTALLLSSFLDIIAGPLLLIPIIRKIDWKFVISVTLLLYIGAYIGISVLSLVSEEALKKIIAMVLSAFIIILVVQKKNSGLISNNWLKWLRYPISFLSGLSGGITGISGPPLVLYLKLTTAKEYFRTQLIAVFMFGSFWRFFWYVNSGLRFSVNYYLLAFIVLAMLLGLWLGNRTQIKVSESTFNRIIALVLIVPVLNIWLF